MIPGQELLGDARSDERPKARESMSEAWVWLQQHPIELSSPLLLSGLGGWVVLALTRSLQPHGFEFILILLFALLIFLASYLAVVVATKKLFHIMDHVAVREGSVLESVMRMPDLWTVLWQLVWHTIKIIPAATIISVAAVVLLEAIVSLISHAALGDTQRRQLRSIGIQIGVLAETVLLSRYAFAIPFMVLGETNAREALRKSKVAVRGLSWRIEGLSAIEYFLVGMAPFFLLRWTGHASSAAHPLPMAIQGAIDIMRALVSTWFVLGLALMAKDVQRRADTA
jgi:hypothetical protein